MSSLEIIGYAVVAMILIPIVAKIAALDNISRIRKDLSEIKELLKERKNI